MPTIGKTVRTLGCLPVRKIPAKQRLRGLWHRLCCANRLGKIISLAAYALRVILFLQNSHPDFYELTPEIPEDGAVGRKLLQIKIDAVRDIVENIYLTAVRGGLRVVLVHPAENMNVQAANGLLKALEEPPQHVVFLMVTHARDKLLPTIKSRCRQMVLPAPSRDEALKYLREEGVDDAESLLAFHSAEIGRRRVGKECRSRWSPHH